MEADMAILWKTIIAAVASVAAFSAHASHDRYGPYNHPYGYSYDRYGNAYDRYGNLVTPAYPNPDYRDPSVYPWLTYDERERRTREYYPMDPRERASKEYIDRAQRGDFDGVTPHPLSKHYSGG
jgi:hypothetical protein